MNSLLKLPSPINQEVSLPHQKKKITQIKSNLYYIKLLKLHTYHYVQITFIYKLIAGTYQALGVNQYLQT